MIASHKRPDLKMLIALAGKDGPPPKGEAEAEDMPEEEGEEDSGEDDLALSQEALDAIKADDAAGFHAAIKAIVKSCTL